MFKWLKERRHSKKSKVQKQTNSSVEESSVEETKKFKVEKAPPKPYIDRHPYEYVRNKEFYETPGTDFIARADRPKRPLRPFDFKDQENKEEDEDDDSWNELKKSYKKIVKKGNNR